MEKPDFNTLSEFLGRFDPEVTGKALMVPQSDAAAKLQRFASGACDKAERAEICEMLRLNPSWLRWVADRVRLARNTAPPAH